MARTDSVSSKSGRAETVGSRTESVSSKSGRYDTMPTLEGATRRESVSSKAGRSNSTRSSEARRKESTTSSLLDSISSSSSREARRRTESLSSSSGLQVHRDSVTGTLLGRRESGSSTSGHRGSLSSYSGQSVSFSYSGTIPGHRGSFSLRGAVGEDLGEKSFSRSRSKSGGSRRKRSRSGLETYSPEHSSRYSRISRTELYPRGRGPEQAQELYSGISRAEELPEIYSGKNRSENLSELYSGMCRREPSVELFPGPSVRLEQFADLYSATSNRPEDVPVLYSTDPLNLSPRACSRRNSETTEVEERTQDEM